MPRLKMNLSDVEVGGPQVPPGQYVAEVTNVEEKESNAGNPMLVWDWEVVGGEHAGFTFRSWTSLQEHALFGLKGHLIGLGQDADDVDLDTDELIGLRALVTVVTRKYKDKDTKEDRESISVAKVEEYKKPTKKRRPAAAKKSKAAVEDDDDEDDDLPF